MTAGYIYCFLGNNSTPDLALFERLFSSIGLYLENPETKQVLALSPTGERIATTRQAIVSQLAAKADVNVRWWFGPSEDVYCGFHTDTLDGQWRVTFRLDGVDHERMLAVIERALSYFRRHCAAGGVVALVVDRSGALEGLDWDAVVCGSEVLLERWIWRIWSTNELPGRWPGRQEARPQRDSAERTQAVLSAVVVRTFKSSTSVTPARSRCGSASSVATTSRTFTPRRTSDSAETRAETPSPWKTRRSRTERRRNGGATCCSRMPSHWWSLQRPRQERGFLHSAVASTSRNCPSCCSPLGRGPRRPFRPSTPAMRISLRPGGRADSTRGEPDARLTSRMPNRQAVRLA